jgi:hypothetical protein
MMTEKKRTGRPRRHGGYTYLTRGELPQKRRYLGPYLSGVRADLVKDLGPLEDDLTAAQRILVNQVVTMLGVTRLIEEHVAGVGIFDKGELRPVLRDSYLRYLAQVGRFLDLLGVSWRVSREVTDLETYLAKGDEEKAASDESKS